MQPLTDDQRRLVEEYARGWDPVLVLRSVWPGLWRRAVYAGLDEEDVRGAGWEGVARAAQDFDPARGASFATYASWWIRGKVAHAVTGQLVQKRGDGKRPVSGDRTVEGGRSERSLWDVLGVSDPTAPQDDPEEFDRLRELKERVADVLRFLSRRHRRIIELRHGFDGNGSRTLDEVGAELGITRERVRQLEAQALGRIAVPLQVGCFDHLKLGRGKVVNERNGTIDARVHQCPTCHKPYPGKRRRCFECKPSTRGARAGRKPRGDLALARRNRAAPLADLAAAMTAADAVRAALAGLDPDAARQVLGWVTDRLGA